MIGEISFDLVDAPDNQFEEGTFRLPSKDWQVFIVTKRPIAEIESRTTTWESGVTGVVLSFPDQIKLHRSEVKRILAAYSGVDEWIEVRGPDSIHLR